MEYNIPAVCCTEITAAVLMMLLQICRKNAILEKRYGDRILNVFIWMVCFFSLDEMFAYMITGIPGTFYHILSWVLNCICFTGTATASFTWIIYADYRLFLSKKRLNKLKWLAIPYLADVILVLTTPLTGLIFTIGEDNIYTRGPLIAVTFAVPVFYVLLSLIDVFYVSRTKPSCKFFPFIYFAILTFIGMVLHLVFYDIAMIWLSIALAITMVFVQLQNELRFRDSLTGLFNRAHLYTMLSAVVERKNSYCGIMADIDDFKKINDTWGHNVGDVAICKAADILNENSYEKWIAFRYAGDEFVLISSEATLEEANEVIRVMKDAFAEFNEGGKEPFKLSVSMGVSFIEAGDSDIDGFIARMDQKMYKQKEILHGKTMFKNEDEE